MFSIYESEIRLVRLQDSSPDSALLITLKNFNIKLDHFLKADAAAANANADKGGSAIALPVHSYRGAKNNLKMAERPDTTMTAAQGISLIWIYTVCSNISIKVRVIIVLNNMAMTFFLPLG